MYSKIHGQMYYFGALAVSGKHKPPKAVVGHKVTNAYASARFNLGNLRQKCASLHLSSGCTKVAFAIFLGEG